MREDAAWSPILREQGALEELAAIGVEIIRNARNELYLSMRFLDVALNGLFPVADNSIKGIGTDGTLLSFETGYICGAVWVYISYVRKRLAAIGADIEIRAKRSVGYTLAKIGDAD